MLRLALLEKLHQFCFPLLSLLLLEMKRIQVIWVNLGDATLPLQLGDIRKGISSCLLLLVDLLRHHLVTRCLS